MTSPIAPSKQDEVNLRLYRRADVVQSYTRVTLHPPEATILIRYRDDFQRRRVLDLGCGAGRLATYLRPLTDQYAGVDFSPHMVAHCQQAFPGLSSSRGDMRDLKPIGNGAFDAVIAINNVVDAVSHEDRLRVFAEIRRVLAPGGLLVFSAHNRNCPEGIGAPQLELTFNLCTQVRHSFEYLRSLANHLRIKPKQRFEPDYALLNDCAHYHSVLHYYIDRHVQAKQLAHAGFELLESVDQFGRTFAPDDDDSACPSVYYVARPKA
jgi:SAM-dependent methyltransferase